MTASADPAHKQRAICNLTEMAIALVPVMVQLGAWGAHYLPASPQLPARSMALVEGGPEMADAFTAELRHLHLGAPATGRSVLAELDAACQAAAQNP